MKTWRFRTGAFAAIFVVLVNSTWAQDRIQTFKTITTQPLSLPRISVEQLPKFGTFYSWQSLQRTIITPPLPYDPVPESPVYVLDAKEQIYLIDDRDVDYVSLKSDSESSTLTLTGSDEIEISGALGWRGPNGPSPMDYGPDVLWIELTQYDPTNHQAYLLLHGTVDGDWYQPMRTNQLSMTGEWELGYTIQGAPGTNVTPYDAWDVGTNSQMYFRAHHTNAVVSVFSPSNVAFEPNAIMDGQSGSFTIGGYPLDNDLPVYYRMSGTASNGVDYTTLTGVVTLPGGVQFPTTNVDVAPLLDYFVEGTDTVTMTLIQTNNYLIQKDFETATVFLSDSSTHVTVSRVSDAVEPDGPPGIGAKTGRFQFARTDDRGSYPQMPILYSISGTASNGVDYVTITNFVVLENEVHSTNVDIIPYADDLVEGPETVTITLSPTNIYSIVNSASAATVTNLDTSTTVSIYTTANAIEPDPSRSLPGSTGYFQLYREDTRNDFPVLTVRYQLSGTAQNDVDYTNLSGTISFPTNQQYVDVYLQAIGDGVLEDTETVTLTLLPTNDDYLISTSAGASSQTISILDNTGPNVFQVVTNVNSPVGIDYSPTTNALILSMNFNLGNPFNFLRLGANGNGDVVTNRWSGIQGVQDEVKLVIVQTNANGDATNSAGFTNGDMFFGSGSHIGRLSADGTTSDLNWATLTNAVLTNASLLRGSLYVDQTGVFSNQLIAIASDSLYTSTDKEIWRVDAQRHSTLISTIRTRHLEGAITVPNDSQKWGPWAGKILTGDETDGVAAIYAISANGVVTTNHLGIKPEDFDFVPPNQDLYLCVLNSNQVLRVSESVLTNYVGDLLITQSGDALGDPATGAIFLVHWDATNSVFKTRSLFKDGYEFEHATFAPISIPSH